ncbi:MAG: aryl-sulfate sulfotransferase [Bacteroidota bacterium]|nr:aryl-sulfate sulfotransferase [Bacteroidota bacterium]
MNVPVQVMKIWTFFLGLVTMLIPNMQGQTQTSGTFLNTEDAYDGYTLLDPTGSTSTYLINNCGEVVNSWSSDHRSGGACYLLDDGSLARGCRMIGAFSGGGVGGRIERRSWDGNLLWALDWADEEKHHHHDFAWMPNGNVLVLAWERKSSSEAAMAGRTNPQTMWPESITEIEPTMPSGGNVVWEWHAWDHLVQNTDATLAHYGEPSENPTRIDVNYANVGGGGGPGSAESGDWMHANAVNYHPELDQIAISSRRFNETWIIDHGITTEEASGPAGDLLYRYGNPEAYGRGTAEQRVLFGQHDVQWIPDGHPQAGKLMVFNNGNNRPDCTCSTIDVWMPPLLEDGSYAISGEGPMGPDAFDWTYPETATEAFYSPNISGVQPLPNGNHLICEGASGHLFEVTLAGELVWDYINPAGNSEVFPQGTTPQQNNVFRAYRYGPNFPGLQNQELIASEPLEGDGGAPCTLFNVQDSTATSTSMEEVPILNVYPNPTSEFLNVHLGLQQHAVIDLMDLGGRILHSENTTDGHTRFDMSSMPSGTYLVQLRMGSTQLMRQIHVLH